MENFENLLSVVHIILWVWMLTVGLHIICQRLRAIINDRGYVTGWEDFVTGLVVVGLLAMNGVI